MGRDMNYVSSVAARAILSVDCLINHAMTCAWTSTLGHRCPGREFTLPQWSMQSQDEENDDGGGFCWVEAEALTEDDLPLE